MPSESHAFGCCLHLPPAWLLLALLISHLVMECGVDVGLKLLELN